MTTRVSALIVLAATAALAAGCGFSHQRSSPLAPSTTGSTTTSTSSSSYVGTWRDASSAGVAPTAPDSCNSFQWQVTTQTATSISGQFLAICGAYSVSGTGSGQLSGQTVTVNVSGSGTATGQPSCAFTLSSTGTLVGDTLTLPYTGTTCFGSVHGTEVLQRTTTTAVVINAPALVSPINGAAVASTQPTLIVTDSTRTGPAGSISYVFQVATDQGFQSVVASGTVAEAATQTQYTVATALASGTVFCWRVQATDGSHTSPWSSVQTFATPASQPSFDLSSAVIVVGPSNFATWPATSTVTNYSTSSSQICIYHTMLGKWPTVAFFGDPSTLIEGNQWYFAYINGKWYGGAGEWLRPGQACKGFAGGPNEFYNPSQEPLHSWIPQNGDQVGLADSTPARAWPNMATLNQRTNIVVVTWKN
jgi:hypothetical protein